MSKREIQHESVRTNRIGAIEQGERIAIPDILYYENPPATYEDDELITYGWAVQQLAGGAKKISIPTSGNPDYPDATLTQDGFSYTINFGPTIGALLGGFEPQLTLIKNGTQVQVGAIYFQFTGLVVTAAILDGMYSPDDVNVKVNFLA